MVIMSVGTWYIMVAKLLELSKIGRQAKQAESSFWSAPSIAQGVESLKEQSPFRFLAEAGLEATKKHEGLLVVFADSFIFVRGIGFGAREVKALGKNEVTVEKVTTVIDGTQVPGLRITGRAGKPNFAAGIALPKDASNPTEQAAVRDELYAALAG